MFRVANLLKNNRLDKELDYLEISKKLKVPAKYIMAIEEEDIKNFPSEPYCSLIVKDYANFLGLNGEEILSLFRRDFDRKVDTSTQINLHRGITPQTTFLISVLLTSLVFVVYLIFEYIKFNRPPQLSLDWPNSVTEYVEVKGKTDPEATVRINQDLVIVQPDGTFFKKITLSNSETKIIVESKSQSGKIASDQKSYPPKN